MRVHLRTHNWIVTCHDEKLLRILLSSSSGSFENSVPHGGILRPRSNFVYLEVGIEHEEGGLVDKTVGLSASVVAPLC